MHILHVCSNYFPAHGGPQYTMKNLSEKLIEYYKDKVEVATSNSQYGPDLLTFKKIEPPIETINGVKIHRYALRNWHYKILNIGQRCSKKLFQKPLPHFIYKFRNELDCKGILNKMKHTNADVIMATTSQYMFCDYPLWRFKTINPKPFVLYGAMHLHINWQAHSAIFKRAKICDCYISNTDFEKNWLIEQGVNEEKIVTIGTAISIEDYKCEYETVSNFRKKNNLHKDDILIGYIGRLSEGKGVGTLLDAYMKMYKTNKKVKLLLAGTYTNYVPIIKNKINDIGVPVILLENFDDKLKSVLFNSIDIFILASKGESFGVVFLEAWACNKPVIGVRMGAVASVIDEGSDGFLFEAGNTNDLFDRINYLVNNKEERDKLGMNGYEKVKNQYTWEIVVEKYRNAYLKAIENFNTINQTKSF